MAITVTIKEFPQRPGIKLIELKGELDILGSKTVTQELLPIIEKGCVYLIADLSSLEYINSTGIYSILQCFIKAKEKGGFLKLAAINARVKEILEVVGIQKLIPLYNSLEEAIGEIKDNGRQ